MLIKGVKMKNTDARFPCTIEIKVKLADAVGTEWELLPYIGLQTADNQKEWDLIIQNLKDTANMSHVHEVRYNRLNSAQGNYIRHGYTD
jgi:hypothetical protein